MDFPQWVTICLQVQHFSQRLLTSSPQTIQFISSPRTPVCLFSWHSVRFNDHGKKCTFSSQRANAVLHFHQFFLKFAPTIIFNYMQTTLLFIPPSLTNLTNTVYSTNLLLFIDLLLNKKSYT